jgi:hypothetical protein
MSAGRAFGGVAEEDLAEDSEMQGGDSEEDAVQVDPDHSDSDAQSGLTRTTRTRCSTDSDSSGISSRQART